MSSGKQRRLIQRSVYRGTSHMPKPAKEKHLRIIVSQTFQNGNEEIIKALAKRMDKQNWAVVLKALYMIHRCFRDGHPSFIESLRNRSTSLFSLRNFSAIAPPNHLYTIFVKKYASYLEEKVSVLRLLGIQFEKQRDVVKTAKGSEIFRVIPKLQSQLNALLNTKMRAQHVGLTLLIHRAYVLLMKDSLVLYTMLNEGILRLLDQFWKMPKKDAALSLNIYKLFVKETDALIGLYELGKTFIRNLPEIPKAETGIIEQMEQYVESQIEDKLSRRNSRKPDGDDDQSSGAELKDDSGEEYEVNEPAQDDYSSEEEQEQDDEGEESSGEREEDEEEEDDDFFKTFLMAGGNSGGNPFMAALFANRPSSPSFSSPYGTPHQGRPPASAVSSMPMMATGPPNSYPQPVARSMSLTTAQGPRGPVVNPFLSGSTALTTAPRPSPSGPMGPVQSPSPYASYGAPQGTPLRPVVNPFLSGTPATGPSQQPSMTAPPNPYSSAVVNPFVQQPPPPSGTNVVNPFL